jgi:hypothetical protein
VLITSNKVQVAMVVSYLKTLLRHFLPFAAVITLIYGAVYIIVQQDYRISANDPQIQLAEDAAAMLTQGQSFQAVVPAAPVDIANSLAPYLVVFDDSGKAVASSGQLHGQMPSMPEGVFNSTRQSGENRVTWQPEPGVRSATVVVHYQGTRAGFVMAGRSLREVENQIDMLGIMTVVAWIGTLFICFIIVVFMELLLRKP